MDEPETVEPQDQSPPKQRRRALVAALIVAALIVGGIVYGVTHNSDTATITVPAAHQVTYKLEGTTASADITYSKPGGGSEQQEGIDVPLHRKSDNALGITQSFNSGDFLYLSAQNHDDSGSITCVIEEDGNVIARNTSTGGFVIATCDGHA